MVAPQRHVLAFAPAFREKRKDADEFRREANRFVDRNRYGSASHVTLVDNKRRPAEQRDYVIQEIARSGRGERLRAVAFFCHGYNRFKLQFGFHAKHSNSMNALAQVLFDASALGTPVVPLYCCVIGAGPGIGGDGGFADTLRDALLMQGATSCRVYGHTIKGHATKNPFVRVFDEQDVPGRSGRDGLLGGRWIIDPEDRPLFRKWNAALKKKGSTLRFRFPFMTRDEIVAEIGG